MKSNSMNDIVEMIDILEDKVFKLFNKLEGEENKVRELALELQKATAIIKKQNDDIKTLQQQYEAAKIANSLLGSEENKRVTRLKINALIRDIDYCVKQLSD